MDDLLSFTPMACQCQDWSDKAVLLMIAEKVAGNYYLR
jgi:hypothetical protein